MKKSIIVTFTTFLILLSNTLVMAQSTSKYPYSTKNPNGIIVADTSIFKDSSVHYPMNSDFENIGELNHSEQLIVSEDSHIGKFSLGLKPSSEEKILIKETDYFEIAENYTETPAVYRAFSSVSNESMGTHVNGNNIEVYGITEANKAVTILVIDGNGEIKYINETNADNSGNYNFNFILSDNGTYEIKVGNIESEPLVATIEIPSENVDDTKEDILNTKTNILSLWIKPKYLAENISFYTSGMVNGSEKKVKILGDKDNDGVYTLGEDFVQGKWQEIKLNLSETEENFDDAKAKNFYISANAGSEWSIDTITSSYTEINSNKLDLSQFQKDNIYYTENGEIRFEDAIGENRNQFKTTPSISTAKIDLNEKISEICIESNTYKKSSATLVDFSNSINEYEISGMKNPILSKDGNVLYYNNENDNNYIYCYDFNLNTNKKVLDISSKINNCNYDGSIILYNYEGASHMYNTQTQKDETVISCFMDNLGDLYSVTYYKYTSTSQYNSAKIYKYYDGYFDLLLDTKAGAENVSIVSSDDYTVIFTSYNYLSDTFHTYYLMKKNNNSCELVKNFSLALPNRDYSIFANYFDNTTNRIYMKVYYNNKYFCYSYDLITGIAKQIPWDSDYVLNGITTDGRLIFTNALYDPNTGETEYFNRNIPDNVVYSEKHNQLVWIENTSVIRFDLTNESVREKYLLSFDGKATWYTYSGGRWILASKNTTPTADELRQHGMTAEQINGIKDSAFAKIYENGTEVYTLNIALLMQSKTPYITPIIKGITVKTIANQPVSDIYSSRIFTYDKSSYSKVDSIFPVEEFPKQAECYYILYLGNEWLYTYKYGNIIKLPYSASELFENISDNWLTVKQYGMTAAEIRNVPSEKLTHLFVNDEFANEEFGVIAAIKTEDSKTSDYNIKIHIQADTKYTSEEQLVLEIQLSGGEKKVFLPDVITQSEIDNFLNWLQHRQMGEGDIFYHVKADKSLTFINYYMITNVNVYNYSDYTEASN